MPGKTSKKRTAPSQTGSSRKKVVLREKNVAEASVSSKSLQRKKPVTQDTNDDETEESDDELEGVDEVGEDFESIEEQEVTAGEENRQDGQSKSMF